MNIYLAGPMQDYAEFNFPAFAKYTAVLRAEGHVVFSPAEKDLERHGPDITKSDTGNLTHIANTGFSLRQALEDDTTYICRHADTIAMMPGWEYSKGANAEWALAKALGHKIIYLD